MYSNFKTKGYDRIYSVCSNFGIPLIPKGFYQSPTLGFWVFEYQGRISDITKYHDEFKSRFHPQVQIQSKNGLVHIIAPKPQPDKVLLGDVLNSDWFKRCPGQLKIAVGKSAETGTNYVSNLEDWEHVLIGGTTGSGKTMFMHSIIHSIVKNNSPEDVKFILFDFKGNEFSTYEKMSYLQMPIIYRTAEAVEALKWLLNEMERRYSLFKESGCKDIYDYTKSHQLNHVIVMMDEFAKLTLKEKDAEDLLVELSQMARASGMYLILTVHRPTKDSIKPAIKEMITTRISFKVNDQYGSRAILDKAGGENLLGNGDMILIKGAEEERIQSCFISNEEIKQLGKNLRDDSLFTDIEPILPEPEKPIDEEYKDFYRGMRNCLEKEKCNAATIYEAIRKGDKAVERVLERAIDEGVVSEEKSYYGRNDIIMTLEDFLENYEEV